MAKEFQGPFECIGENNEIYKSFPVLIKKEVIKVGKEGNKAVETISYKIKFIDSMRFMQLRYKNLSIIYLKFIGKSVEIKTVNLSVSNKFSYNCKKRRKEQLKPMNGLIKKFSNTYELCNGDINKFISLMRKGFYPYEYTDSEERYNEVSLPEKEAFDSELNLGDTSDEDYIHAQKVIDEFKLKSLGEYHDLYLKNYVLLLTEVFANFRSMYLEI